jgi:hypothetical protein
VTAAAELPVPVTPPKSGCRVLSFEVALARGPNRVQLTFWKWKPGPRPLALLVSSITVIPDPPQGGAIEPKPQPARVLNTPRA